MDNSIIQTTTVLIGIVGAVVVIVAEIHRTRDRILERLWRLDRKINKYQAYIGQLDDELTQIRQFYEDTDHKETFHEEEV